MTNRKASIQTLTFLLGRLNPNDVLYQVLKQSIHCMEKLDEMDKVITDWNTLMPDGGWKISDGEAMESIEAIYIYGKKED